MLAIAPQGGIVAAIAARAMATELHTDEGVPQTLRSIHGVFASPVPDGPLDIEVTVLRRGRSMSQAQATVRAPAASAGFTALAVFGSPRSGFDFTELQMPVVPGPDECPSYRDPPPPEAEWPPGRMFPFWYEVLDGRPAQGHAPWDHSPRGAAEVMTWFKWEQPPVVDDGLLDPFGSIVMVDMMPNAVFEKIGPTDRRWFAPSIDLTVHLLGEATPGWVLVHNKAHHASDGYASVECALWDPRGADGPTLVAWATQQMFFTPFD